MAEAYLGEIRIFAGNFAPKNWALCNGQLLPIASNSALYSILGTQYGGDGKTTFALPNLMGSAPMHHGSGPGLTPRRIGERIGSGTVALTESQMPQHTHIPQAINAVGSTDNPEGGFWAQARKNTPTSPQPKLYEPISNVQMSPAALSATGGSQPHNNMQPFIAQNFIICIAGGEYPSRGEL